MAQSLCCLPLPCPVSSPATDPYSQMHVRNGWLPLAQSHTCVLYLCQFSYLYQEYLVLVAWNTLILFKHHLLGQFITSVGKLLLSICTAPPCRGDLCIVCHPWRSEGTPSSSEVPRDLCCVRPSAANQEVWIHNISKILNLSHMVRHIHLLFIIKH